MSLNTEELDAIKSSPPHILLLTYDDFRSVMENDSLSDKLNNLHYFYFNGLVKKPEIPGELPYLYCRGGGVNNTAKLFSKST